jgi:quercetin dioxygenase-like cupin family protein
MFRKRENSGYREVSQGIEIKTLVHGEKMLSVEFRLRKGNRLPDHAHPHEQSGYMVSGHLLLSIGEETFDVGPGDSWSIPGHVEHGARVLEDSVAVEVFSPIREDYLPAGARS